MLFSQSYKHVLFLATTRTGHQSVVVLNRATFRTVVDDDDRFPIPS